MTIQALVEALLSIPLYGFKHLTTDYSNLFTAVCSFNSIVWILHAIKPYEHRSHHNLSIPLYGFVIERLVGKGEYVLTFNSIVWIQEG